MSRGEAPAAGPGGDDRSRDRFRSPGPGTAPDGTEEETARPGGEPRLRAAFDALQARYIAALDGKDMPGWLACFEPDGSYYAIGADNDAAGLPLCLMMDDTYARLEDRVTWVTQVWPGAYEDYQTRHFVQCHTFRSLGPEEGSERPGALLCEAQSNFLVMATDAGGRTAPFVTGLYRDRVRVHPDGRAGFVERRAVMDTFATPGVVVYPL